MIEADDAASKIAQAETDDQTRRAAVMIGLERSVDDFPVCTRMSWLALTNTSGTARADQQ